uniref:IgGFc_binding domain-containing protein n=2 Tax=Caenorhabditis tropicalis TaxID=1561998 RepID=A0A1I7UJV8_9PELO
MSIWIHMQVIFSNIFSQILEDLRKTTSNSTGSSVNLCCESGRMTVGDWFTEKQLTPDIVPQAPYTLLQTITLSPASSLLNFPPIHVGDEVVVLSFPSFITGIVQSLTLTAQVNPGYVHVVTIIDPLYKPFAVLMNYNIIVGQPSQTINVTSSRFVAYLDNSASMPRMDSYRSEYVVLVYYTASQIYLDGSTPKDMILGTSCSDTKCLFTNSALSPKLGQPLAGTVFYVNLLVKEHQKTISLQITTKNTVFTTSEDVSSSSYPLTPLSFVLAIFIHYLL